MPDSLLQPGDAREDRAFEREIRLLGGKEAEPARYLARQAGGQAAIFDAKALCQVGLQRVQGSARKRARAPG